MRFNAGDEPRSNGSDVPRCPDCSRPVTVDGNGFVRAHHRWQEDRGYYRMPQVCTGGGKRASVGDAQRGRP